MRFLLLPHYPHIGPQAGLRSCGLYYIDMLAVGNGLCQPGGGRCALGFGDRKHRRTAVETRSAAALGQQVLCCRWSARGSIKRAPANSQRPPACITTNQQPLGRAKSADGPASAASHRSNMAFLSTRTSTPPGRGPVNMSQKCVVCAKKLKESGESKLEQRSNTRSLRRMKQRDAWTSMH